MTPQPGSVWQVDTNEIWIVGRLFIYNFHPINRPGPLPAPRGFNSFTGTFETYWTMEFWKTRPVWTNKLANNWRQWVNNNDRIPDKDLTIVQVLKLVNDTKDFLI